MGYTLRAVNQFMPQHLRPPVSAYFQGRRRRLSVCGVTHYVLTLVLVVLHAGSCVRLVFSSVGKV